MLERIAYLYKCEYCGKESEDKDEILKCESKHFGISVKEKAELDDLKNKCDYWKYVMQNSINLKSESKIKHLEEKYKQAQQQLLYFEEKHNSKSRLGVLL